MNETPLSNASAVWARVVDQADQGPPHEQMVPIGEMQDLERAANAMRAALKKCATVLSGRSMTKAELIAALTANRTSLRAFDALKETISPHNQ